jgi:hypothetical protein
MVKNASIAIALGLVGLTGAPGLAAAAPVVVGFDRFGESGETGVAPGLLLYNELKCGACHGIAGRDGTRAGREAHSQRRLCGLSRAHPRCGRFGGGR